MLKSYKSQIADRRSQNKRSGFSLLEALVAISVLIIAFLGVYDLVSFGVSRASFAKNQNIAFFLGQEGMEYIINKKMTNSSQGNDWLDVFFNSCQSPNGCYADAVNDSITQCPENGCPKIKFDSATGYNYLNGTDTVFQRKIITETIQPDKEIKLTVEMKWRDKGREKSFVVEDRLFNWW